ncbi:hypothetical protein FLPS103535_12570 [Flavobacterium psychrophilum]
MVLSEVLSPCEYLILRVAGSVPAVALVPIEKESNDEVFQVAVTICTLSTVTVTSAGCAA